MELSATGSAGSQKSIRSNEQEMLDARPGKRAGGVGAFGNLLDVPNAVDILDDLRGGSERGQKLDQRRRRTCELGSSRRVGFTLSIVRSQFGSRIFARSIKGSGTCQSSTLGGLMGTKQEAVSTPDAMNESGRRFATDFGRSGKILISIELDRSMGILVSAYELRSSNSCSRICEILCADSGEDSRLDSACRKRATGDGSAYVPPPRSPRHRRTLTDLACSQHPRYLPHHRLKLSSLVLPPIKHPAYVPPEPVPRVLLFSHHHDWEALDLVRARCDGDQLVAQWILGDDKVRDRREGEQGRQLGRGDREERGRGRGWDGEVSRS